MKTFLEPLCQSKIGTEPMITKEAKYATNETSRVRKNGLNRKIYGKTVVDKQT